MKLSHLTSLLLVSFISIGLTAQSGLERSVYEDALSLKQIMDENDGHFKVGSPKLKPLIDFYFEGLKDQALDSTLANHVFLNPYYQSQGQQSPLDNINFSEGLSKAGNLDVTNLALGLTDFLIERTKTELNTAFFKRFEEELNEQPDLKALFPHTVKVLSVIGVEIYQYDLYLNSLRAAFEKDLKGFLNNVPKVLENHEKDLRALNSWTFPTAMLSVEMINMVEQGDVPGEIIGQLGTNTYLNELARAKVGAKDTLARGIQYAANGVQTLSLLSESFRSSADNGHYWVNKADLEKLKDPTVLRLYLGLLYEVSKRPVYNKIGFPAPMKPDSTILLKDFLRKVGTNWNTTVTPIQRFVLNLSHDIQSVQAAYERYQDLEVRINTADLEPRERNKQAFDAYYDLFSATLELLKQSYALEKLPFIEVKLPEDAKRVISFVEYGGELTAQVVNKQYAGAVSSAAMLLDLTLTLPEKDTLKLNKDLQALKDAISKVLKYGSFMAALVEAESPEEAKAAIEAVALPPGSYTIKRESNFSVALNGYLGFFAGSEWIDNATNHTLVNNLALSAPVGFSFSWGDVCRSSKNPWSLGIMFSVIDLGNVASYRFDNGSATDLESVPSIQLKHIVAPGLFFEAGWGGTPLTLGFGAQIGPRLRQIEAGANANDIGGMYVRLGATVKVDIPILSLYASPGHK
jgi:hypothetical protein